MAIVDEAYRWEAQRASCAHILACSALRLAGRKPRHGLKSLPTFIRLPSPRHALARTGRIKRDFSLPWVTLVKACVPRVLWQSRSIPATKLRRCRRLHR